MGKKITNFKKDSTELIRKLPSELSLAILLGTLPVYFYSNSKQSLDDMVSGLLAIGQLIDYFGWMLAPYAFLLILKYCIRFNSDRSKNTFNFLHKIISESGTGFQTILRTGAGVAIGIILLPNEITTATLAQSVTLSGMTVMLIIFSCAISFFKDHVTSRTERQAYKNPLKLDIK